MDDQKYISDDHRRRVLDDFRRNYASDPNPYEFAWKIYSNTTLKPEFRDLSKEREFLENLVQTRFNFYIVTYGVMLVYGLTSTDLRRGAIILLVGAVGLLALALAIYRIHMKLDFVLKLSLWYPGVLPITNVGIAAYPLGGVSAIDLIGMIIPFYGAATLVTLGISTLLELWLQGKCWQVYWFLPTSLVFAVAIVHSIKNHHRNRMLQREMQQRGRALP